MPAGSWLLAADPAVVVARIELSADWRFALSDADIFGFRGTIAEITVVIAYPCGAAVLA